MRKTLRCYVGRHRWQQLKAEGGGWYKECLDCGKYKNVRDPWRLAKID